ncbi:hypothetical protein BOX15_Mlig004440g4 [Macrostomum lignano]|uniref:PH domain-containing protein n=1 Tax=Macrostomum lignano TaxID=282301 RepID=A0A267GIG5_9PLAT|nr:hypothetical protein BOX15_Mlig004440g4 [Macrostomum lignano]
MQTNCDLLQQHSRLQADKSGCLQVLIGKDSAGESGGSKSDKKLSSKSASNKSSDACICRLVGNLLFVTKGIDPLAQDCDYLIVLEACKIEVDYSPANVEADYPFRLVFDYESQTVLFRAASEEDRGAWVAAFREASIFDKLDLAESARQKIIDITGQDPLEPTLIEAEVDATVVDANAAGSFSGWPTKINEESFTTESAGTDPAATSNAGGLELDLSLRCLPALTADPSLQYPNAYVEVHACTPPLQSDWSLVGRTDVVENSDLPMFRKVVVIPDGQYSEDSTELIFDVFDVRDQISRTMRKLYSVQAALKQLRGNPELSLLAATSDTQAAVVPANQQPTLTVQMRVRPNQLGGPSKNRHAVLLRHLCTEQRLVASNPYKFPVEQNQMSNEGHQEQLSVQEFMCDLKCGMHVPMQIATIELTRLRSLEAALVLLGEHNCPQQQRDDWLPLYRLSASDKLLAPLVSALCQEFSVCVEETNRRLFDGDFMKLSRLRSSQQLAFVPPNLQLHRLAVVDSREKPIDFLDIVSVGASAAHSLKFKKGGILSAYKSTPGLEDVLDVCEQAVTLLHEGNQLCDQLNRILFSASNRQHAAHPAPGLASQADSERLCDLVNRLIFLASNFLIVQTRIALELQSVGMQQLNKLLEAATSDGSAAAAACDQLLQEVNSVWQQCRLTLAKLWLTEAGKVPADTLLVTYRRRAQSFSQMLTAVVCGVAAHFSRWNEATWRQMEACGIPVYMESLLSVYKSECGMLEDMAAIVPRLAHVKLSFFPGAMGDQPIVDESLRSVRICVPQPLWDRLSASLDCLLRGHRFSLVPLMFSVGINEQQTLAEKKRMASLAVQRDLNKRSAVGLRHLVDQVIRYRSVPMPGATLARFSGAGATDADNDEKAASPEQRLRDKLQQVELFIEEDKSKPVGLLHTVEEMFWLLDGVRLTNCKSGKDRTAMAVTLEQARWLREYHRLRSDRANFESTVAFLRTHGLRRRNCFRNIGTSFYAFNRVQLTTFPQMYRPPKGTYERGPT